MEGYTEIKAKDLAEETIRYGVEDKVEQLAKGIISRNKFILFFIVPISLIMKLSILFLVVDFFLTGFGFDDIIPTIIYVLVTSLVIYVERTMKKENKAIKKALKDGVKKAQYGEVYSKRCKIERGENGKNESYYIDVIFTKKRTIIKDIEVSRSIYNAVYEEDNVLVLSFDEEKAYCINV